MPVPPPPAPRSRAFHGAGSSAPVKAHAAGPVPYRALLAGGRLLAEAGVWTREQGLAAGLAQALARRTGHGVDVETAVAEPMTPATAHRVLTQRDLTRLDALLVLLEPVRSGEWAEPGDRLAAMLTEITGRLTVGSAVVVVVPPPMALGLSAVEVGVFADDLQRAADPLTRVVRLDDGDGDLPPARRYARWAERIAEVTADALIEPMVRFLPDDPFDDDVRVDVVRRLQGRYGTWTAPFQAIVEAAASTYGAGAAAMSVVDDERTHYFARTGAVASSLPRGSTICNRVLRRSDGLIVGDAALDPRLGTLPEVRSRAVTFYAGYRIEAPDGAPLGALCVFDPRPRAVREADLAALRGLAIRAQRLILETERARSVA